MTGLDGAARYRSGASQEHFEHGPIRLVIDLDGPARNRRLGFDRAFSRFERILDELVVDLGLLRSPASRELALTGPIAHVMNAAALTVADGAFVTPMVAVAGAVADDVCQVIAADRELVRVVVNNGGDVAFALAEGQELRVGVVPDLIEPSLLGRATVAAASSVRGAATSGRHGRSFSMGIADSVSVFASTAAVADAAATIVANAVMLDGPEIVQRPAVELDAASDLGDRLVTVRVGELDEEQVRNALDAGRRVAEHLLQRGLIDGAVLALNGQSCTVAEQQSMQLEPQ